MNRLVAVIALSTVGCISVGCDSTHPKHYEPDAEFGGWIVTQPISAVARLSTESSGGGRSFIGIVRYWCSAAEEERRPEGANLFVTDLMDEFVHQEGGSRLQWDSAEIIDRDVYDDDLDVSKLTSHSSLRWSTRVRTNPERYDELRELYMESLSRLYADHSEFDPDNRREEWQSEVVFLWNLEDASDAIADTRRRCGWSVLDDADTVVTTP